MCVCVCVHNFIYYSTANLFFITGAYYPPSVLSVIDDVDCMNNANTGLSSCYFNTTDTGPCYSHDYDANLICFNCKYNIETKDIFYNDCELFMLLRNKLTCNLVL